MAIVIDVGSGGVGNYTDLQASIARWMNRTDLGADIPGFIANAEARIATDLRVRKMLVSLPISAAAGEGALLPAGWLEFKSLSISHCLRSGNTVHVYVANKSAGAVTADLAVTVLKMPFSVSG